MPVTSRKIADLEQAGTEAAAGGGTPARSIQEAERLAALDRIGLCDTPPSEAFDRITRRAASALDAPIALVSLVAETRQWFKSKVGLGAGETSREVSFCAHAVAARAPLIVPDALLDARFADNPLVSGEPGIRAYAGVPVCTSDGHAIGTLCVIDRRPREFSAAELGTLRDFASMVEDLIHAMELVADNERALYLATERETSYRELFEHAGVGMIHASLSGRLLRANLRMTKQLGYPAERIAELSFADITHPSDLAASAALLDDVLSGAVDRGCLEKRYVRGDGTHFWGQLSLVLKRAASGKPRYLIAVIADISERKQQEAEREDRRDTLQAQLTRQSLELAESNGAIQRHVVRGFEAERTLRQVDQRLRVVADCVPSMIGYWNRDLRCEFANEAHRAWFGLVPEQIVGMSLRELLGANFEQLWPHVRTALQGTAQRFERSMRTPASAQTLMEFRFVPDLDECAEVRGFFMQVTEVAGR